MAVLHLELCLSVLIFAALKVEQLCRSLLSMYPHSSLIDTLLLIHYCTALIQYLLNSIDAQLHSMQRLRAEY